MCTTVCVTGQLHKFSDYYVFMIEKAERNGSRA